MNSEGQSIQSVELLHAAMVDALRRRGSIRSKPVAAAFSKVPRHLFAPGAALETAYALDRLVTKRDEHGITISSISAPQIQAMMLEQSGLDTGMRALEIGSGGYNAALMAELVGKEGEVTTVDIDPDVVDRARRCLADAGYTHVNVVLGDGEEGAPGHALYDRLIVTVGAWDIPPAWVDQLAPGGSITVPLRMRGLTRSITFEREADHLVSRSVEVCGFVRMQGAGAHPERLLLLRGEEVGLRFDDAPPADPGPLGGALATGRSEAWSGVTIGRSVSLETLHLWLATTLPGFCLIAVDSQHNTGRVAPVHPMGTPTTVDGGSFAYLAVRPAADGVVELGAHAFGPEADALAEAFADQVRIWDRDHRLGPGPRVVAYPAGTPDQRLPHGLVVDKSHVRIVISWPSGDPSAPGQTTSQYQPKSKE